MIFIDQHSHSTFSPDSRMSLAAAIDKIMELNEKFRRDGVAHSVQGIAITDHLDLDAPRKPNNSNKFIFDVPEQQKEIDNIGRKLAEKEGEREDGGYNIKIYKGIEVGLQPCSIEHSSEFIRGHIFDVVIASLHFVDSLDPYLGTYFEGKSYKEAFGHALETMYQTITAFKDFDILGHFDYVARYSPYDVKDLYYRDFPDQLDAILKYLAENGKALEINTKSYSLHPNQHIQELDRNIIKRFKELKGEFITLGSDAHTESRICDQFIKYAGVTYECGFKYLTYFEDRKAKLIKIE